MCDGPIYPFRNNVKNYAATFAPRNAARLFRERGVVDRLSKLLFNKSHAAKLRFSTCPVTGYHPWPHREL